MMSIKSKLQGLDARHPQRGMKVDENFMGLPRHLHNDHLEAPRGYRWQSANSYMKGLEDYEFEKLRSKRSKIEDQA